MNQFVVEQVLKKCWDFKQFLHLQKNLENDHFRHSFRYVVNLISKAEKGSSSIPCKFAHKEKKA